MARSRTVLVAISPLLGDLLVHVLQPHLHVVARLSNADDLLIRLPALLPDLLILAAANDRPALIDQVFRRLPACKILVVEEDGYRLVLHESGKTACALTDVSPEELLRALCRPGVTP